MPFFLVFIRNFVLTNSVTTVLQTFLVNNDSMLLMLTNSEAEKFVTEFVTL